MSVRKTMLVACATLALAVTTACSISVGGSRPDPSVQLFDEENILRLDLSRPIEAESLGLPADQMEYVAVPEDPTVHLTLPTGTWSGRTEEMAVTTRHGFVDQVDLFWTEADGQAAADHMVDDAPILGFDTEQVAGWAETARWAETADTNRTRHDENFNGANGEVSTSVRPGMAVGEGAGTPVRLWYKFYVRHLVESAGVEPAA